MEASFQDWALTTSTPTSNTQFRVMTLFNNTVPPVGAFDPALDALNYTPQTAGYGSGKFYYTGDGGGSVPAGHKGVVFGFVLLHHDIYLTPVNIGSQLVLPQNKQSN